MFALSQLCRFLDFWNLVAIKVTWLEMIYETVAWNQIHWGID